MQDLRVIGAEDGALLVTDDDGTRYRIAVDDALHSRIRQVAPSPASGARLAPREIQAHIRAGMSAEDVASITGAPLEHIRKFEGPVLAEREFVVKSALAVPVHTALETDPLAHGVTFGIAIRERVHDLGGAGERWASWKDLTLGWIVKLSFIAHQIDHDARWRFDPKKQSLEPMNNEAVTLSQQSDAAAGLMPRLRAVHQDDRQPEASRFDSGAFDSGGFDLGEPDAPDARARLVESTVRATAASASAPAAEPGQTADLLDALRRRRGEREAAAFGDDDFGDVFDDGAQQSPASGGIRLVEIPLDTVSEALDEDPRGVRKTAPQPGVRQTGSVPRVGRKGRTAMPSWDEIVFGARPDDDLA